MATKLIDSLIDTFTKQPVNPQLAKQKIHRDYYGNAIPKGYEYEEIKDLIASDRYEYILVMDNFMDYGEIKENRAMNRMQFDAKMREIIIQKMQEHGHDHEHAEDHECSCCH